MSHIDLNRLIRTLEPNLRVGLETAASLAVRHQHAMVDIAHWLRSLLDIAGFSAVFEELAASSEALRAELDAAIADIPREAGAALALSPNLLSLGRESWLVASLQCGRNVVLLADLLAALTSDSALRAVIRGIAPSLRNLDRAALERLLEKAAPSASEQLSVPATSSGDNEFLRLYTHDMTADARAGRIDPVIGRDRELRQLIDILTRRRQNNPILVGEAGVGKTAVAEALALEIAAGNVPDRLKDVKLLLLDLSLLQAGAGVKGEFERRLHGVVDAVKTSPQPIILFIDEAHGLIGAGGQAGQGDAANILKPALARGELRTIAATTWGEYKRFIEKDAALTRRFQTVHVREPDEESAIRMLRGVAESLKAHHKVRIRDEAIVAAVRLSARYLPDRQLPDKAISLIDTAAAAVALARQTMPEALKSLSEERDLLEAESSWLAREPETPEKLARLADIAVKQQEILAEIEALRSKFDEENRLVREADRLEEFFSPDDAVTPLAPADNAGDGTNVAPFPPQAMTAESARAALAATERSLAAVTDRTPLLPRVVDKEVVAAVVARWTGIPLGKLLADQIETVKTLDARLKERVLGQDAAIGRIASAMRAARAGLSDPRRPPAVFLLVGMSGTGKTETALSLADMLYGGSRYLTTINMSEFKEEHKISMLLGSPPGYVGYGEGGVLTEAVRQRPYSVVLLDEVEKAHLDVMNLFYQVFDKGMLSDGEGKEIDFSNTVIFLTSNLATDVITEMTAGEDKPDAATLLSAVRPILSNHFKPALLARMTVIPYFALATDALAGIVRLKLDKIVRRVAHNNKMRFTYTDAVVAQIAARCTEVETGARNIDFILRGTVLPLMSQEILTRMGEGAALPEVALDVNDSGDFAVTFPGA